MAQDFLMFANKLIGRYAKLLRLDVVGGILFRREVAIGGLVILVGMSFWPQAPIQQAIINVGANPSDAKTHLELAKEAAKAYDYELAEEEYRLANQLIGKSVNQQVLGARDEVFPEEVIKKQIDKWEKIAETVNSRDVWLRLAGLHWQIFDEEKAREYWQKAWWIDPNNEQVNQVNQLIK